MKTDGENSFLSKTPSWALALLTLFGATFVLFGIAEGLSQFIKINEVTGEAISYSLNGIIITVCCYFIVRRNSSSIWYVLLICNAFVILPAIVEPNFWISTSMWIPMCGGLVLSIIASLIGTRTWRKSVISDNP
jgi:hypothetical protein